MVIGNAIGAIRAGGLRDRPGNVQNYLGQWVIRWRATIITSVLNVGVAKATSGRSIELSLGYVSRMSRATSRDGNMRSRF